MTKFTSICGEERFVEEYRGYFIIEITDRTIPAPRMFKAEKPGVRLLIYRSTLRRVKQAIDTALDWS